MAKQNNLVIHIPPDSSPDHLRDLLGILVHHQGETFTSAELRALMEEHGFSNRQEIPPTAKALGLIAETGKSFHLSSVGLAVSLARQEIAAELLHYLNYSAWTEKEPRKNIPSWAYRTSCRKYWQRGEVSFEGDFRPRMVAEINGEAQTFFSTYGLDEDPSFSPKSLRGVAKWLQALQPHVLTDNGFSCRTFCIPELVILAIGYSVRDQTEVENVDILLTRERRECIAQLCLLAPEHLDSVIDYAIRSFPQLIQPGTTAGFYGRFIRLLKRPMIEDVIR